MNKISHLFQKNGIVLTILRLPSKISNKVLNRLNTIFWSFFLREMGTNCLIEFGVKIENPKQLILKDNVYIATKTSFGSENYEGLCILNNNVHINRSCKIDHTGNVELSEYVLLSEAVTIFSHSHGYNPYSKAIPKNLFIGKNSWIGYRSIILESVEDITNNCIISAGAIVTKNCLQKNTIYAGIPAKQIKVF